MNRRRIEHRHVVNRRDGRTNPSRIANRNRLGENQNHRAKWIRGRLRLGTGRRRRSNDRGSATIWAAGVIAALLVIAAAVLEVGAATDTRHRADSAADLAALAAAEYAPDGEPSACGRARWVAAGMNARLDSCRLAGWDALVVVDAQPPGLLIGLPPVTAHARAGPAGEPT
jgi:secretion/DNA translocation related TadE-like protein